MISRHQRLIPAISTLSLLAVLTVPVHAQAPAQPAPPTAGFGWTLSMKRGDVVHYHNHSLFTGRKLNSKDMVTYGVTQTERATVADVSAMGDVTLDFLGEAATVEMNGKPATAPAAGDPARYIYSRDGRVIGRQTEPLLEKLQIIQVLAVLMNYPAPPTLVQQGARWKTEFPNPLVRNTRSTLISTLVGPEVLGDIQTLRVKVAITIPTSAGDNDSEPIQIDGYYNVEQGTGRLIRSVSHVHGVDYPLAIGKVRGDLDITRLLDAPGVTDDTAGAVARNPGLSQ